MKAPTLKFGSIADDENWLARLLIAPAMVYIGAVIVLAVTFDEFQRRRLETAAS